MNLILGCSCPNTVKMYLFCCKEKKNVRIFLVKFTLFKMYLNYLLLFSEKKTDSWEKSKKRRVKYERNLEYKST